ncbi:MAG: hypothetical protein IID44_13290 [Planctomycetes bacterium]|nr:hypothetical protein [Planctomycetota bacterium]
MHELASSNNSSKSKLRPGVREKLGIPVRGVARRGFTSRRDGGGGSE